MIKDLTRNIIGKNYVVYCDNYFTSVDLFKNLLQDSIYACGILWSNRKGYPQEFKKYLKKGLPERGNSKQIQDGNLVFSLWQDNKPVTVLSTNCQHGLGEASRKQRSGSRQTYPCPLNIVDYNKYMGGIDRNDQLRQYYCVRPKSRKVYKYIFWFMFEVTLANVFILQRYVPSTGHKEYHYLDFRVKLAKQLIGDFNGRTKAKGPPIFIIKSTCYWRTFTTKRREETQV